MPEYKFSVGTYTLTSGTGDNIVGVATGVTVSYDGGPVEFRGGDYRLPLAVEMGDESVEITVESSKFDVDQAIANYLSNATFTLTLGVGSNSGGLVGAFANCKITNYEVVSEQSGYVLGSHTIVQLDAASTGFAKSTD